MGQSKRLEELKDEIAKRIRPMCDQMPGGAFDAMVAHMATVALKYEGLPNDRFDIEARWPPQ